MKTIIAGCRTITDPQILLDALKYVTWDITEVVCGMAPGVDTLGLNWANDNRIPVKRFPANWKKHKNGAGPIRNSEMAEYSDALLAIWDSKSTGTADMINKAVAKGMKIFVYFGESNA